MKQANDITRKSLDRLESGMFFQNIIAMLGLDWILVCKDILSLLRVSDPEK